ncbi:hypothetical protein ACFPU0_04840 [Pseudomonas sp. GCM10022186]|uniref:hypothetical protein n=1 Tax=Pseudomonas sp. GCM10022186 TaxID=3252650 RepID=UPI0036199A2F
MDTVYAGRLVRPMSGKVRRRLKEAMSHAFVEPVTGYLTHVRIVSASGLGFVYGHVRADVFGRFADGHLIRTSDVRYARKEGPFWVLTTLNSRYVIVSFKKYEGRPSLQYFLKNLQSSVHLTPARLQ